VADRAVLVDDRVADFARRPARAAIDVSVDHQPGANAGREHDERQVADPAAGPEARLGERAQVGVVVDMNVHPEPLPHRRGGMEAVPARQDRRRAERPGGPLDRRRQRQADAHDRLERHVALRQRLAHEPLGAVDRTARVVVDVEPQAPLGEDRVREVGHRQMDLVMGEVDPDDGSRRGIERQQDRRPPALRGVRGPRIATALGDQSDRLEVADDGGHRRPRKAGQAGDLRPARRSAMLEGFDHREPIAFP
jgi:hypothetical protein